MEHVSTGRCGVPQRKMLFAEQNQSSTYQSTARFRLTKHDDYLKSLLTIFKASSVKNWHELITKPQQRKFNQICETLCTHTDDLCYSQPSHSENFSACGTAQLFGLK